jgi:hypothetical protein
MHFMAERFVLFSDDGRGFLKEGGGGVNCEGKNNSVTDIFGYTNTAYKSLL